eukprot:Awhi_evm1s13381
MAVRRMVNANILYDFKQKYNVTQILQEMESEMTSREIHETALFPTGRSNSVVTEIIKDIDVPTAVNNEKGKYLDDNDMMATTNQLVSI